jgi:hypothetical protein
MIGTLQLFSNYSYTARATPLENKPRGSLIKSRDASINTSDCGGRPTNVWSTPRAVRLKLMQQCLLRQRPHHPLTTPSFTGGPCRIGRLRLNILMLLCSTTPALLWQPDGPLGLSSRFFIRAPAAQGFYLRPCSFGFFGATGWPVPFAFFRPRTLNEMSLP